MIIWEGRLKISHKSFTRRVVILNKTIIVERLQPTVAAMGESIWLPEDDLEDRWRAIEEALLVLYSTTIK